MYVNKPRTGALNRTVISKLQDQDTEPSAVFLRISLPYPPGDSGHMVPVSQVTLEQAFGKPVTKEHKILGDVTRSHALP